MDKERLPRWGWLLLGLLLASVVANTIYISVLRPAGLPAEYQVAPVITAMAPVIIYVGVWYDEDKRSYWNHSRTRIAGDLLFVVVGAAIGAATALAVLTETGLQTIIRDVIALVAGFLLSWGLFWWRNSDLYE